MICPV
jgi:hypothetical protein